MKVGRISPHKWEFANAEATAASTAVVRLPTTLPRKDVLALKASATSRGSPCTTTPMSQSLRTRTSKQHDSMGAAWKRLRNVKNGVPLSCFMQPIHVSHLISRQHLLDRSKGGERGGKAAYEIKFQDDSVLDEEKFLLEQASNLCAAFGLQLKKASDFSRVGEVGNREVVSARDVYKAFKPVAVRPESANSVRSSASLESAASGESSASLMSATSGVTCCSKISFQRGRRRNRKPQIEKSVEGLDIDVPGEKQQYNIEAEIQVLDRKLDSVDSMKSGPKASHLSLTFQMHDADALDNPTSNRTSVKCPLHVSRQSTANRVNTRQRMRVHDIGDSVSSNSDIDTEICDAPIRKDIGCPNKRTLLQDKNSSIKKNERHDSKLFPSGSAFITCSQHVHTIRNEILPQIGQQVYSAASNHRRAQNVSVRAETCQEKTELVTSSISLMIRNIRRWKADWECDEQMRAWEHQLNQDYLQKFESLMPGVPLSSSHRNLHAREDSVIYVEAGNPKHRGQGDDQEDASRSQFVRMENFRRKQSMKDIDVMDEPSKMYRRGFLYMSNPHYRDVLVEVDEMNTRIRKHQQAKLCRATRRHQWLVPMLHKLLFDATDNDSLPICVLRFLSACYRVLAFGGEIDDIVALAIIDKSFHKADWKDKAIEHIIPGICDEFMISYENMQAWCKEKHIEMAQTLVRRLQRKCGPTRHYKNNKVPRHVKRYMNVGTGEVCGWALATKGELCSVKEQCSTKHERRK